MQDTNVLFEIPPNTDAANRLRKEENTDRIITEDGYNYFADQFNIQNYSALVKYYFNDGTIEDSYIDFLQEL
jgi:predicted RNA-binding protein associated with RNAse of E/G family